jgi:hypothetical protein
MRKMESAPSSQDWPPFPFPADCNPGVKNAQATHDTCAVPELLLQLPPPLPLPLLLLRLARPHLPL